MAGVIDGVVDMNEENEAKLLDHLADIATALENINLSLGGLWS